MTFTLRSLIVLSGLIYGLACCLRAYQVSLTATDWIPVLIFGPVPGVILWLAARFAPQLREPLELQLVALLRHYGVPALTLVAVVVVWTAALTGLLFLLFADTMVNGGTVLRNGVGALAAAVAFGPLWPHETTAPKGRSSSP